MPIKFCAFILGMVMVQFEIVAKSEKFIKSIPYPPVNVLVPVGVILRLFNLKYLTLSIETIAEVTVDRAEVSSLPLPSNVIVFVALTPLTFFNDRVSL